MMKKILAALSVSLLLQVVIPVMTSTAAEEITVIESSTIPDFPNRLNFSLSAESSGIIDDVRLHYYVDRRSYVHVTSEVYIEVLPGRSISAEWSWDMRKTGGLPPGTTVKYWWSISTEDGKKLETQPVALVYTDSRFDWQKIEDSGLSLYWYKGNESFARELLTAAVEGLERLDESTGVKITSPVRLYIYADSSDLQNAMIFPQTWTGGVAYPLYGCVAIGIDPSNLEWGLRTVVHELTHLVVHQLTYNPYLDLPVWLDEGLSMYMEGPLSDIFDYYLTRALENGELLSVPSLASPFSAYADQSYLSYAESYSIVFMLINNYGQEKMLELLTVISRGTDYDEALLQVYGFDMDGLDDIWRNYIMDIYGDQPGDISGSGTVSTTPFLPQVITAGSM